MKVTALITCKNEEDMIGDCLDSVSWADEVFVVDSGSTDRTVEIARSRGARVESHEYVDAATQKNWAIPRCSHEWVLVVDSDEIVTEALAKEIRKLLSGNPKHAAYRIRMRTLFLGRELRWGDWGVETVTRLLQRDKARYPERRVHADLVVDGSVGTLRSRCLHRTYRGVRHYFEKLTRYSRWWAEQALKDGRRTGPLRIAAHATWAQFRSYFLKLGFLDGMRGLVSAELWAASVVMKYLELWELQEKRR